MDYIIDDQMLDRFDRGGAQALTMRIRRWYRE